MSNLPLAQDKNESHADKVIAESSIVLRLNKHLAAQDEDLPKTREERAKILVQVS